MSAVSVKKCTRCGDHKPVESFRANPRYADGRVNWCAPCAKAYRAEHYQRNKDRVRKQNAAWHEANRDSRKEASRIGYAADPQKHIHRVQAAKDRNPDHYREMQRLNARKRRASRVELRIRSRLSAQLRYCLSTGKGGQTTESLLGYSVAELRTHLERQFLPGMRWENMGEWHIDHIVSLSSFTITGPNDPELRRAWALTNLRPLWAAENMKKSNKRVSLL